MFIESLVFAVCLQGGKGCSESTNAYYNSNLELQKTVKNIKNHGDLLIKNNKWIVYILTPAYAISADQPARFPLTTSTMWGFNFKKSSIFLEWNY